jgi:hypothetical protein
MVRLSIIMPSNRDNLTAISRIAQACSWAGPQTEVIIRDNSGSFAKRRLLAQIEGENCHLIAADPCDAQENASKALERAQGEFVFLICDDDSCFDRAMADLPARIEQVRGDPSIVGIIGAVVVENRKGSSVGAYRNLDDGDALTRVAAWLSATMPPVLLFSPVRRDVLNWVDEVIGAKPFKHSFDDQICSLLYLLRGRFAFLDRLLYVYDQHNWEQYESAQMEDLKWYIGASLDPAINKLHWLLCAFEGAMLVRALSFTPDFAPDQRQKIADIWFTAMFQRFLAHPRADFGSPLAGKAEKLCQKWKAASGQLSFEAILADISEFMSLASPAHGMAYFQYWSNVLTTRRVLRPDGKPALNSRLAAG